MTVSIPGGSVGATGPMRSGGGLSHLLDLLERAKPSWHARAACRNSEVDFFADTSEAYAAARALCGGCAVAPQCGHYGTDEDYGVWGGLAPFERGKGRRRRTG